MIKKALSLIALGLFYLISLLPFWILYLLADFLYLILYYVAKYRFKVVDENLLNAFPEKSVAERQMIRKQYFHHLADLMVETIKLFTISNKEIVKRVKAINPDIISKMFTDGKSVIGILGHYGNWEMNALRFSQLFNQPRIIVYKPLNNPFFNKVFVKLRSRFGAMLVNMKGTARKLLELRNERTMTVLVADQTPAKPDIQYFTNFLNQPTPVFLGPEKLAKLTNSVVVFCDIRRIKRGYYQCEFVPITTQPQFTAEHEITNAHVRYLENVIRQEPEYWLWSHRRWKFKPEDVNIN